MHSETYTNDAEDAKGGSLFPPKISALSRECLNATGNGDEVQKK